MESSYFPVFYDITGWNICFFGAGKVAERRIKTLSQYPCHIYVISGKASKKIQVMAQERKLIWIPRDTEETNGKKDISEVLDMLKEKYKEYFTVQKEFSMILACTNHREINQKIYEYCKEKEIPVNIADCRQQSDFYFPGVIKGKEIVIGVTGNGENHQKVKTCMDTLRKLPDFVSRET